MSHSVTEEAGMPGLVLLLQALSHASEEVILKLCVTEPDRTSWV
jgi:hypothetical protein